MGKMRRLQSYTSLPAAGADTFSALAKKLRFAPQNRIAIINAPAGYLDRLAPAPRDLYRDVKAGETYDAVQLFVNNADELRALGPAAIRAVNPDGLLWVVYPKGGVNRGATDLPATPSWTRRDVLGEFTGELGYKPVAFVKIDDNWTALRFKKG